MTFSAESLENLMAALGGRGKFQLMVHVLIASSYFSLVFHHVIMAFHGSPVPHTCMASVGNSLYGVKMTNDVTNTSHSQCSTTFYFSDGRIETVLCTAGQWRYTPVHNEWNIVSQGLQTSTYTLAIELYVAKYRPFAGVLTDFFFGSSVIALAGLAYLLRNWRHLQIGISVVGLTALAHPWIVPESLRWLIMKGKTEKAYGVIKRICKLNKIPVPDEEWEIIKRETNNSTSGPIRQCNLMDLVRNGQMRQRSLILFYVWIVISANYFGLILNLSSLHDNLYLLLCIGGVLETSMYALSLPIMNMFGRKKPILVVLLLSAVFYTAAGLMNDYLSGYSYLKVAVAMLGLCATSCQFVIIFVYTSEMYPTVMRNIGMGACSFWARVGSIVAPQINHWSKAILDIDALIIFGVCSFIAALTLFPLPETHNQSLPDTMQETETKKLLQDK